VIPVASAGSGIQFTPVASPAISPSYISQYTNYIYLTNYS
jgi:hypothetical protein